MGSRLLVVGKEQGRPFRLFVQDLDGRQRRAITPEGLAVNYFGGIAVNDFGNDVSPDGKLVAAKDAQGHFMLFPVEGGEPRPVPGTKPRRSPGRLGRGQSVRSTSTRSRAIFP